jgi:hypothetical protein
MFLSLGIRGIAVRVEHERAKRPAFRWRVYHAIEQEAGLFSRRGIRRRMRSGRIVRQTGRRKGSMKHGRILLDMTGDVAVMTLNDPSVLNAFG